MMSAIGSGATREGVLILSLGTSGTAFAYSPTPLIDEREWVAPFCDATGGHLPLICVMNMTGVLHEVRELLMPHSMDELTELASRTDAGSNGLLLLPYLGGERTPNIPNATGSLMGIRTNSLRPGPLFRAALEGIALSLGRGVSHMRALGLQVNEVRVVGGGASNSLLCQILADVINAPLRRLITNESAALGAAMHAMAAVLGESAMPQGAVTLSDEIYDPNADLTALYSELSDQLADTTTQLWG
jgi:xylulokinase